jgi:hypothetical protein
MVRGTTASFKFELPYTIGEIRRIKVKFWQKDYKGTFAHPLPIIKELTTFSEPSDSKELVITLTAAETAGFTDKLKGIVQLVGTTNTTIDEITGEEIWGDRFASHQQLFTVYPLDDSIVDQSPDDTAPVDGDGWTILDGGNVTI